MSPTMPAIIIGGSAASGGGNASTNTIGTIGKSLAQLIANGANVFNGTGSRTFYLDAGVLSLASPAQIGRVLNGITITAAMVAQNQNFLNEIGAYCRANGISVTIGAQLGNPPAGDWTYQWLNPAVEAGLPITEVENVDEPENVGSGPAPEQWASYQANIVAQIASRYHDVKIGAWVGGSPTTAESFWTAYNALAQNLHLPKISYAVADTSWNAPWVKSPAQWQSWLQEISATSQRLGMSLNVLLDGTNGDISSTQWTAQSEQHAAMLAQMGLDIAKVLIQTWVPGGPTAVSPLNDPSTMGNDALEIAATWPLYSRGLISGSSSATLSCPGQASTTPGQVISLSGITVTFNDSDVAATARYALVITSGGARFFAQASGGGIVSGSGSGTIVLDGTRADISAELRSLTMIEAAGGPDTIDVEVFNNAGRAAEQQIHVSTIASANSGSPSKLTFLPSIANGGVAAGWTSETETRAGGKITSQLFTWNAAAIDPASGKIRTIKQDAIHLPDNAPGVIWKNGVPQNPAANMLGSNPLSTTFNASAFNSQGDYTGLTVLSTLIVFNPQSGNLESTTDIFAPYPTASGSGQGPAYLATGGRQITYHNTGDNPLWKAVWGKQFKSVVMTYGSQGQLLEMVYQGSAANGYQTVDQVFDPITGRLMESIQSFLPPGQYSWFVTGPVEITYFNTGYNPEWDKTEWGSRHQVTVTWQDYYAIGVSSVPPPPMVTSWTGASQCGQQLWAASGQSAATLSGIGCPGNVISVSAAGAVLGGCTVGSDGQWAVTLKSPLKPGLTAVSITEADTFDGTGTSITILMQVGNTFVGTASSVLANFDTLQTLAARGCLSTITFTGASIPSITITAAQAVNDGKALACIAGSYQLVIAGVTAANAAGAAGQAHVIRVSVSDTADNVQAALSSLQTLFTRGKLAGIALTDARTPTLVLTTSQSAANASALGIISSAYNLSITGVSVANALGVAGRPHVAKVLVSDTGVNVLAGVETLERLAAAGKLGIATLTDAAKPSFTLTAARVAANALALSAIGSAYNLTITGTAGNIPTGTVLNVKVSSQHAPQITLTDATGRLAWSSAIITLDQAGTLLSEHFNWRAGQPCATTDQNYTNGLLYQTWNCPVGGGYALTQKDLAGTQDWSSFVQTVNASNQLVSLDYAMRPGRTYSEIIRNFSGGKMTSETDKNWNGGWQIQYLNYNSTQAWSQHAQAFSPSGQMTSDSYTWTNGQPYASTTKNYVNGKLYQTWNCPAGGGYILTQYDTTGTQSIPSFVQTVSAQNTIEHLQQFLRAGSTAMEVDAYYDVKNPNSHDVLTYSGTNVQVQVFDASGARISSNTVPAGVISTNLLGGPLHFVYGSVGAPKLQATSLADEFIITPPGGATKAAFDISGFDVSRDIIALPYLKFGNDPQILQNTHFAPGGAILSSLDGTNQVFLAGVDPAKLTAQNFLNI